MDRDEPITLRGATQIALLFDAMDNEDNHQASFAYFLLIDMKQWMIDEEMYIRLRDFHRIETLHQKPIRFNDLLGKPVLQ